MEMPKNYTESSPQDPTEKFRELYGAEMTEITYDDLPEEVKNHFEDQSSRFILPEEYTVGNFSKLYQFTHPDGDVTYLGQQEKTYGTDGSTDRLTYFVDIRDGQMTGYLELRLALTDLREYFKDKPFVGYTRTQPDFFNQGLAKRRLEEANAYSLSEHSFPLHSDTIMTEGGKRVWESLIADGKAEKYDEDGNERFRFISQ